MVASAVVEPLIIISLLLGGTWVNRNKDYSDFRSYPQRPNDEPVEDLSRIAADNSNPKTHSQSRTLFQSLQTRVLHKRRIVWQHRRLTLLGWSTFIRSPDTCVLSNNLASRTLSRFPFLVEVWYWALVYWVRCSLILIRRIKLITTVCHQIYQLGRAVSAVLITKDVVIQAKAHALQLVDMERWLNIFWEPSIQQLFLKHGKLVWWLNRVYSFVHIPGTILFLIGLYHYTTPRQTSYRLPQFRSPEEAHSPTPDDGLYEARRRTMAMCNLIAFAVFTIWPCMPPRLLRSSDFIGHVAEGERYDTFVDTVHGPNGARSVWTQNRFCNQYGEYQDAFILNSS